MPNDVKVDEENVASRQNSWQSALNDLSLKGPPAKAPRAKAEVSEPNLIDWRAELRERRVASDRNVDDLHPIVGLRIYYLLKDIEATYGFGKVSIISGVRSYEHQQYLYDTLPPGQAANPNTVWGDTVEGVRIQGSNHQEAEDGYGRAVDLTTAIGWEPVHQRLARNGLRLAVFDPYEPWHVEATVSRLGPWLEGPWTIPCGYYRSLRRLSVGGDVAALQKQLGITNPDGVFGPGTESLVRQFQKKYGLVVDGVWGPRCQKRFETNLLHDPDLKVSDTIKKLQIARSALADAIELDPKSDSLVSSRRQINDTIRSLRNYLDN